jgi:alginate O-acetyltransferase complex protein AlgJ
MNAFVLRKHDKIALIAVFILFIYVPFFTGFVQEDRQASSVEKRNLAVIPAWPQSIKDIIGYPNALNAYYADHFGFRDAMTKIYFKLANKIGHISSVEDVTLGKDGWLFLGSVKPGYQRYEDPIGDAMNLNRFTKHELEIFANLMSELNKYLAEKGIKYIYVIAPNKHTIYFDKLPSYISKKSPESATDQIVRYLHEHTDVVVLDLRDLLLEEKKNRQVYYQYDTHWNHYGANIAQFAIMQKVRELLPESDVAPTLLTPSQFSISTREGGDLATFARIESVKEIDPQPIIETACKPVNETPNAKVNDIQTMSCKDREFSAVIFGDSFITQLQPYIARQFRRSTYIWKRLDYNLLEQTIQQEKPDIVIEEVVERSFPYIPTGKFHFPY